MAIEAPSSLWSVTYPAAPSQIIGDRLVPMSHLPGRDGRPQSQPSEPEGQERKRPLPGPVRLTYGVEAADLPAHDEACRYLRGRIRPGERSRAWREAHPEAAAQFLRTRAPGRFEPYDGQGTDDGSNASARIGKPDQYDFGSNRR